MQLISDGWHEGVLHASAVEMVFIVYGNCLLLPVLCEIMSFARTI
jgi:hypothetical protein